MLRCKPLERLIFGKSVECQLWLWIVSFRDKHACHRWCAKLTFQLPNQQMCSTFLVDGGLLLKHFSVMFLASSPSWGLQVGEDGNDKLRCVFDFNNSTNRALCWPKDPWQDSLQRLKKSLTHQANSKLFIGCVVSICEWHKVAWSGKIAFYPDCTSFDFGDAHGLQLVSW
jgi:hypothetical protein